MSLPAHLTVIWTGEVNGVLKGIFVNDVGDYQYPDGRITNPMDAFAWWPVPDFTKARGVDRSGYFYVLQDNGYHRCTDMVKRPDGTVAFRTDLPDRKIVSKQPSTTQPSTSQSSTAQSSTAQPSTARTPPKSSKGKHRKKQAK